MLRQTLFTLVLAILVVINTSYAFAQTANSVTPLKLTLSSTYHSISVYSNFSGDGNSNATATLEYRKVGTTTWTPGMDMWASRGTTVTSEKGTYPNLDENSEYKTSAPIYSQFRASILMVQPNTDYEIRVTYSDPDGVTNSVQTGTIKTWNENPTSNGRTINVSTQAQLTSALTGAIPGDNIIVAAGNYTGGINISKSGTATNWITIKGASLSNKPKFTPNIQITGSYIRLGGFEISGGNPPAIAVYPPGHDVIIENNYVHNITSDRDEYDIITIGNTFTDSNSVRNVTVQDNELRESGPSENENATIGVRAAAGGFVFRRNAIYFDFHGSPSRHGTDCFAGLPNFAANGGFMKDTDIYENLCQGSTDDSIEIDGGNAQVRVWNNTILGGKSAFSIAPVFFGPVYIFRNQILAFDKQWIEVCQAVKDGNGGQGAVYFYHNTFYGADPTYCNSPGWEYQALGGFIKSDGQDGQNNVFIKNNILEFTSRMFDGGRKTSNYNLMYSDPNLDNKFAEMNGTVYYGFDSYVAGTGNDKNTIFGKATFVKKPTINRTSANVITSFDADMRLASTSLGIDKGVVIKGFNDANSSVAFVGNAPDMGAFESGFIGPTSTPFPTSGPTSTPGPTSAISPTSAPFPGGTYTLLGNAIPSSFDNADTSSLELGVKFSPSMNGKVTGVRYYKSSQTTGIHTGSLWSSTGTRLGQVTFTNETASGWQQANFGTPIDVIAGTTYIVSYFSPQGRYAQDVNYFDSALTNGPLTAFANGTNGVNGVYSISGTSAFPTNGYQASNYYADVIFVVPPQTRKMGNCDAAESRDNDVDIFDYNILVSSFGSTTDLRCDFAEPFGEITIFDYNAVIGNFGT